MDLALGLTPSFLEREVPSGDSEISSAVTKKFPCGVARPYCSEGVGESRFDVSEVSELFGTSEQSIFFIFHVHWIAREQ